MPHTRPTRAGLPRTLSRRQREVMAAALHETAKVARLREGQPRPMSREAFIERALRDQEAAHGR